MTHKKNAFSSRPAPNTGRPRGRPPRPRPAPRRIALRCLLTERLSEACAAAWRAVPPRELRRRTRCTARIASARQTAIYFVHVFFSANLTRAGRVFGRDRTTARHACSRVEDWRDDARIDRAFDLFEPALRTWLHAFGAEEEA